MKKIWRIFCGANNCNVYVKAASFDDALAIARKVNGRLNSGQLVYNMKEIPHDAVIIEG